jgi:hypothetical protein
MYLPEIHICSVRMCLVGLPTYFCFLKKLKAQKPQLNVAFTWFIFHSRGRAAFTGCRGVTFNKITRTAIGYEDKVSFFPFLLSSARKQCSVPASPSPLRPRPGHLLPRPTPCWRRDSPAQPRPGLSALTLSPCPPPSPSPAQRRRRELPAGAATRAPSRGNGVRPRELPAGGGERI